MKKFFVYIMTNFSNEVFYVGMTSNISRRSGEHKSRAFEGFTKRYKVYKLVYFEVFNDFYSARDREVSLKRWKKVWKMELIETINPNYQDLVTSKNYGLF